MARFVVVAVAAAAALLPIPQGWVEHLYSTGVYPRWQAIVTTLSNAAPIALLDVLIVVVAAAWLVAAGLDIARRRARGWGATLLVILARTIVWTAAVYLIFLASWGLNYRRVRLIDRIDFNASRVSAASLRALTTSAVSQLNASYASAKSSAPGDEGAVDADLAAAFSAAQRDLGDQHPAVPGRPKHTLLDAYFRRAVVDGMTDPIFLETLVVSDLLPVERPIVVAHEWAHLAGYNDEGDANFVGWLACMRGTARQQYSGWIFVFNEAAGLLERGDRQTITARLEEGPRADLRAIADRVARNRSQRVSEAGWRVYNQYLKANRVEAGAASYGEVIRLILGTKFAPGP
jgi:hypothetical protein